MNDNRDRLDPEMRFEIANEHAVVIFDFARRIVGRITNVQIETKKKEKEREREERKTNDDRKNSQREKATMMKTKEETKS